jgi:hypothetical protein
VETKTTIEICLESRHSAGRILFLFPLTPPLDIDYLVEFRASPFGSAGFVALT